MPLPRFERLETERQEAILHAAVQELAEHGFQAASYNRIIDAAGLSKGAMYYYFADKADLYRTILQRSLEGLLGAIGVPNEVNDADGFWSECEAMYRRLLGHLTSHPIEAQILWHVVRARARGEALPGVEPLPEVLSSWTADVVRVGQDLGALRRDLPEGLLPNVAFGMLEGMDRWLADHWDRDELSEAEVAAMMVGLLRRAGQAPAPQHRSANEGKG